jgi:uncharacterized protein (UPF0179 family)
MKLLSAILFGVFLFIVALFMMGCATCPTEQNCMELTRRNLEKISIEQCLERGRIAVFSGNNGAFTDCRVAEEFVAVKEGGEWNIRKK